MINLFIKAFSKLRILKIFNLVGVTTLRNKKFSIPVIRSLGKENLHVSEQWMCKIFDKLLPLKEGLFVDIGVNTGQTLLKLKATDEKRKYIGFEPNPNCVFYVQELIRRNKFTDVVLYPVGLADRTQLIELNFFTTEATDAAASIIKDFRAASTVYRKEFIPCFKFSDINLQFDGNISIIKIDVEGAELEVIQGLLNLLEKDRPFILIEILPVYDATNNIRLERQKAIEKALSSLNYKILRVLKKGDAGVESIELLAEIGIHSNMSHCDYILCPEESLKSVIND